MMINNIKDSINNFIRYRQVMFYLMLSMLSPVRANSNTNLNQATISLPRDIYFSNELPDGSITAPIETEIVMYSNRPLEARTVANDSDRLNGNLNVYTNYYPEEDEVFYISRLAGRRLDASMGYRLALNRTGEPITGYSDDYETINLYDPKISTIERKDNVYILRVPVTVQLFKTGHASDQVLTAINEANPNVKELYTGIEVKTVNDNNQRNYTPISIFVKSINTSVIAKTVQATGGEFSRSENIDINSAAQIGALLGSPLLSSITLPFNDKAPTAIWLSPKRYADYQFLNSKQIYETGIAGVGYRITNEKGDDFTPADAQVDLDKKQLSIKLRLQFIKTGFINPASKLTRLQNLGSLRIVAGEGEKAVVYNTKSAITFSGLLSFDARGMGCE